MKTDLNRFLQAQENTYADALQEMKNGKKTSHWMWYVFPQIKGLGKSSMARTYEIQDLAEAKAYLQDQTLGERLLKLTGILVNDVQGKSAEQIFCYPDFLKFHSCLTLFDYVANTKNFTKEKFNVFQQALEKYYGGKKDENTLKIIENFKT
ncbi:DUF1810 domain-containing protein [Kaistella daneshvariae]|uniref:DUF1810 domain-containing protein n=1 Tax=Kaistella daneshvariae TaxID=2487074 RepID=A0ABN5T2K6_9FLAO|nr:DUF1810 domain-containing protein [Kaistella daneshvariae]AZI67831.1 DUF1810 domain-containing protein [Kaistella daneshvariae]